MARTPGESGKRPGTEVETMSSQSAAVLCLTATGLSIARSLGPRGVGVFGVDGDSLQIGHHSRFVGSGSACDCGDEPGEVLGALEEYADSRPDRPVLLVAGDEEIRFVSEHAARLRERYNMFESYGPEFSGVMLNKIEFYRRCAELEAPLPMTFFPASVSELAEIGRTLRYPAIIKPAFGHEWRQRLQGQKVLTIGSADELAGAFERYELDPADMVIQEVIPGTEKNIAVFGGYFNRDSEPLSVFTAQKTRQYPPMFGSASLAESRWYPDVAELSMQLVSRMGYHGICGTEFKWDPRDAAWKLIEINFRPTLWFAITRAAGVDIVWDAFVDMTGGSVTPKIGTQRDGVLWQYAVRDLVSFWFYLRRLQLSLGDLWQFVRPWSKEYAVLSFRDLPAVVHYPRYVLHEYRRHR